MTHQAEVLCTYLRENFAFGINLGDNTQVFIPRSVASRIAENKKYKMIVSENFNDIKNNTPWFAHMVIPEDAEFSNGQDDIEEIVEEFSEEAKCNQTTQTHKDNAIVLAILFANPYPMRNKEVMELSEIEDKFRVNSALKKLHKDGKIVRMPVERADRQKASICYWAISTQAIREFMEG
jgi:hypothetical protein